VTEPTYSERASHLRKAGLPVVAGLILAGALVLRWVPLGGLALFLAAGGVFLTWFLERRVFGAARALERAIDRLARGDLNEPSKPLEAFPELADLRSRIDTVRDKLMVQAESEREAKSRSEMIANLSHELRTPMTGVVGLADLLEKSELTQRQQVLLNSLRDSADLLLTLLDDVVDLERLDESALQLDEVEFDLRRAVRLVGHVLQPGARNKGIELETWVAPDVPITVRGDATRLQQVLFNLVGNAVKFTESGSVRVEVRADAAVEDGIVPLRFEVVDTGIGIPAEQLPRLFGRYVQGVASTHRRFGGSGLGLAISKRLVELMGGCLSVESAEGAGSRFHFELRLPVGTSSPDPDGSAEGASEPHPGWARGLRLLVAEDHEVNRQMIRLLSEQEGFRVTTAEDGRSALRAMERSPFDLVLMDVHMPDLDGIEATRQIRRLPGPPGRTPVVALTADATLEHHNAPVEVGLDAVLLKPFHRSTFVQLAHRLLLQSGRVGPAPAASAPVFVDRERLDHLAEHLQPADLMHLIRRFSERMRTEVDTLLAALDGADAERTQIQAHRLAGFAANFGARALAEWARQVEHDGPAPTSREEVLRLTESTLAELDRWLEQAHQNS
jgi:signal transduction histidine kinase/CheY-like chemotaxis protein/HPt (histidine-containing phosphotransfer) domain-containing protein